MLPLIAGYDHIPALISLPSESLGHSRGQDIATIPAGLLFFVPIPKLGSVRGNRSEQRPLAQSR
jgi:hypothetical protein